MCPDTDLLAMERSPQTSLQEQNRLGNMLMGRFCLKLLILPPRLQHWESVGVISSGILSTGKGETLVPNTSRRKSQWGPAGAAAQGSSTTGQRSPCPLRLATEGNTAIFIISIYMAKSNFYDFRSFHKHRWQRNTRLVAERDVPLSAPRLSCPSGK